MQRLALALALPLLGLCALSCSSEPVADPDPQANQENQENQKDSPTVVGTYSKDGYNYIPAAAFKGMLDSKKPVSIIDIQVEEEFAAHSIPGAIATYSYPVKSEDDKAKLDAKLAELEGDQPVVVVCPRGGGGAKRCYDHLAAKVIAKDRLLILEKGQAEWSYEEYTKKQ
jgi:rhodanese-related sulfurtransferase